MYNTFNVQYTEVPEKKKKFIKTGIDQYQIDAGQKKFGATQCSECGVIYQVLKRFNDSLLSLTLSLRDVSSLSVFYRIFYRVQFTQCCVV